MSSTEATRRDGRSTDTTQSDPARGTAAERLGGPSEREQSVDPTREQSVDPTREQSVDTTREQSVDTTREQGARREADPDQSQSDDRRSDAPTEQRATLIPPDRAESFNSRWTELKGQFVDEPRGAVRGANELVGEVLDELEELFRRQRDELEQGLDSEQTTTEDLRQALGRYRSFFDRLLSF
jgi:hypothetical protein